MKTKKPTPFTLKEAISTLHRRWTHAEQESIGASSQRGDITEWARGTTPFRRPLCAERPKPVPSRHISADYKPFLASPARPWVMPPSYNTGDAGKQMTDGEKADARLACSASVDGVIEKLRTGGTVKEY